VAADAVLARETPAHLVGEAIWWAGEKVNQLAVRISITDESGNRTERRYSLEPADPQVDQAALAAELGVAPLPDRPSDGFPATAPRPASAAQPDALATRDGPDGDRLGSVLAVRETHGAGAGTWPARSAPWTGDSSGGSTGREPGASASLPGLSGERLEPHLADSRSASRTAAAGLLPRAEDQPPRRGPARPVSAAADPLAAAGITGNGAAGPLEYRGRPLHLVRSQRFAWDYEVPAIRRVAGPLRAELWTTRDGGLTWQKAAVDADGRSPIDVELSEPGFYGVRLELVADVPDADAGPRSGAEPDAWVGIDTEPPQVELVAIDRDEAAAGDVLVIRYAVRDPLLPANSVRLLYSPNAEGPWATIADTAANEGSHRWEPGRSVPARVFVRLEATDAAGNKGIAVSDEAVSVAPTRFGGKLGGLRVLPTP